MMITSSDLQSAANTSAPSAFTPDSTGALAEWLRRTPDAIRVCGRGTWMGAGRPTASNACTLRLQAMSGVVEYVPGDLTMTVRAGTALSHIDALTRAEGQWIGIDPAGSDDGSIGATVATASTGPLAHGIGRMRDLVLGLELVTGDGRVTRSGGKVVKNVAGFDLTRLQTGAWGTLGIITEVSLRLRALPEIDSTVAIALDERKPLAAHLHALRELAIAPLALELVGVALATKLGVGSTTTLLVRFGGNETRVTAQRRALSALGDLIEVPGGVWHELRAIDTTDAAIARVSHLPSELARTWAHVKGEIAATALDAAFVRATVSRGVVRAVVPRPVQMANAEFDATLSSLARNIVPPGGHGVWEQLPLAAWQHVPSAVADNLSAGLQRAFDPDRRLNIGILGTGAA